MFKLIFWISQLHPTFFKHSRSQAWDKEEGCDRLGGKPTILTDMKPNRNLPKDLAFDRTARKLEIHVLEH